jgi:hypothetical protein
MKYRSTDRMPPICSARIKALLVFFAWLGVGAGYLRGDDGRPPSESCDLSHWKLTLPVGVPNSPEDKAMEISARQLATGYINPEFFYSEAGGAIVFWCPVNGATTENTEYPRSELREVIDPLDDNVNWGAPGTHVLEARCRVREVPSSQKVIIGQIHSYSGRARPLIKLQFYKGKIEALVKESPAKGKDIKLVFPEVGLDRDFTFKIKLEDGLLGVTVNDMTLTPNVYANDPEWAEQTFYFKAGAYPQDNEGPASEGARVSFSDLMVEHSEDRISGAERAVNQ